MPFMTRIPSDLARFGLRVELVPGWETRGSSSFAPAGVTCHWTAGPRGTTGRPSLGVVTNGRPGLAGPLCNVYFARDATCVVVAAGRANHAGEGGFRGLVGNSSVYGIEAESGGDGDWTDAQRANYPRVVAALLSGLGRDASWAHGHNEWTPRKIDIRDIIGAVRAQAGVILANPALEDDMQLTDRVSPVTNVRGEKGAVTVAEALGAAWEVGRGGFWQRQEDRITALTETVRGLSAALANQDGIDLDVDALLAGVEDIVQRNRATLNVAVSSDEK